MFGHVRRLGSHSFSHRLLAGLLASTVLFGTAIAADRPSVARWVEKASWVGSADESKAVTISVYLNFKNMDGLKALVAGQATPGSADYGRYLTPSQFHARFAPAAADVARVEASLRSMGFTITREPTSRVYIEAKGTVGQIKQAFGVSQELYQYGGKIMRANAEEPKLPASIAGLVTFVGGLAETGQLIHPRHQKVGDESLAASKTAGAVTKATAPLAAPPTAANLPSPYCSTYYGDKAATLSTQPTPFAAKIPWLVCGYTPQQVRSAYGADKVAANGAGVTVAIVDAYASPTIVYDATRYAKNHNLVPITTRNFSQIVPDGIYNVSASEACGPQGWYEEESLDVAAVHTMAPGATIIYFGARDCNDSLGDTLYDAIDGGYADIITNSYGYAGDPLSTNERLVSDAQYLQAAAQGISLLFSAGDDADAVDETGIAEASYPAASPYATAVGGTTLALLNSAGTKSEWGWGTFRAYLSGTTVNSSSSVTDSGVGSYSFYSGSGGGPALYEPEPAYQLPVVPSYYANTTYDINGNPIAVQPPGRVVPDISMVADPYTGMLYGETYTIAGDPVSDSGCTPINSTLEYCEGGIGGTSLASPLFAGTLAVVEQLRHAQGLPDLGLVNQRLYRLGIGAPGSTAQPIVDIQPPVNPTAMLRGYVNDLTRVRVITVNSLPYSGCPGGICEGVDGFSLGTAVGYDNNTGLGVPYIPKLATTLAKK